MRKSDKIKNIIKANLLTEQKYVSNNSLNRVNENQLGDNSVNNSDTDKFLTFIKQTRLEYIQKWAQEIKKYKEHLKIETDEYAIKLKKDEIERLKKLISVYSQ